MSEATILRKTAKGQPCFVRLPGVCNHNPETTVLAHMNGGGIATKRDDFFAAFCCSDCHNEIDRRTRKLDLQMINDYFFMAILETQQWWIDHGYIKIVNAPQPRLQKILPRRF